MSTIKTPADRFKQSGLDVNRQSHLLMNPEDLTVVTDPNHPLFDVRVTWPLDEKRIEDFRTRGVIDPVKVRENGKDTEGRPILQVVDGRRRVLHLRELNRRLVAEGSAPQKLKVVLVSGDDASMIETAIACNSREDETILSLAGKMQKAITLNVPLERVAAAARMELTTARRYLAIVGMIPEVQQAFESGDLKLGAVESFLDVPREEQAAVLAKLREAPAPIPVREMPAAVKAARAGKVHVPSERQKPRSGAFCAQLLQALREIKDKHPYGPEQVYKLEGAIAVLRVILREDAEELSPVLRDALANVTIKS